MLPIETACLADIGRREEQQDRVRVFDGERGKLLVLADGAGGHAGGALAAQAVIDVARETLRDAERGQVGAPADLLKRIALGAHERINALGAERGITPHSTCVLLHIGAAGAAWAHVGDSRLYRFADGRLVERTMDHSIVELQRLRGRITEAQMKTHPDKNRLYEALGGEQTPQIDAGGKERVDGDGYLLVSDGVWENTADGDLEAVFMAEDLDRGLRHLLATAKAQGRTGCDNLSAAAARWRAAT